MSPIPEIVRPQMFTSGVEDRIFVSAVTMVEALRPSSSFVAELPGHKIVASDEQDTYTMKMDRALLFPNNAFNSLIKTSYETGLLPHWQSDFNSQEFWKNAYGIDIVFNCKTQTVHVSRKQRTISWKDRFMVDSNTITSSLRTAIIALAVLPDSLWPQITQQGLAVGECETCYDQPWKFKDTILFILPNSATAPSHVVFYWTARDSSLTHDAQKNKNLKLFASVSPVGVLTRKNAG